MKKIRYEIRLQNNDSTETILSLSIESPEEKLEENLSVIKSQDYVGDIIIEDISDEQQEPTHTTEQRVSDLEEQLAQSDETAIALYEAQEAQEVINAQQDEALMEIYEMLG